MNKLFNNLIEWWETYYPAIVALIIINIGFAVLIEIKNYEIWQVKDELHTLDVKSTATINKQAKTIEVLSDSINHLKMEDK